MIDYRAILMMAQGLIKILFLLQLKVERWERLQRCMGKHCNGAIFLKCHVVQRAIHGKLNWSRS